MKGNGITFKNISLELFLNYSFSVNSVTLMAALVCLCEPQQQLVDTRASTLFDLVDFDNSSQISLDETVSSTIK